MPGLDVVLRDVPIELSEQQVEAVLRECIIGHMHVQRFMRTAGTRKPMPLVRVQCTRVEQAHALLDHGVCFGGELCRAEVPKAGAHSSAARGLSIPDEGAILRFLSACERHSYLVPEDMARLLSPGDAVFCMRNDRRLRRGGWQGIVVSMEDDMSAVLCRPRNACGINNGSGAVVQAAATANSKMRHDAKQADAIFTAEHAPCVRFPRTQLVPLLAPPHGSAGGAAVRPVLAVCATTSNYRRVAACEVRDIDCVLEIGSDLGVTTALIADRCHGRVLGIDLSAGSVEVAQRTYPDVDFMHLDVMQDGAFEQLHSWWHGRWERSYTMVFIDINGNRPKDAVARVAEAVALHLAPQLIVIKSSALHQWVQLSREQQK